jgi:bacterioferritin
MSDKNAEVIKRFNKVLSWELAGTIQYLHHHAMVSGLWREVYAEFFADGSKEARKHAELVADKIVALGGVPTVEPARIRQATTLEEMLQAALELEEAAMEAWEAVHAVAGDANMGTLFWVEEMISEEQEHVDGLRKLLKDQSAAAKPKAAKSATKAG